MKQTGSRNRRMYRIVAIDEHKKRDGSAIEVLGIVNPTLKPPHVELKRDRIAYWLKQGAQMTDAVAGLVKT